MCSYFDFVVGKIHKMQLYSRMGMCTLGQYKSFDKETDIESCNQKCLKEDECQYVSFSEGKLCGLSKDLDCKISRMPNDMMPKNLMHITYQKVTTGKCVKSC